ELKKDLKFANGHKLTSSDVKFSFERQLKIADANGPSQLLANLKRIKTPNSRTVQFILKTPHDQLWPQVLTSPAGPIVDEQVFPKNKLIDDQKIVKSNAFSGQYRIAQYEKNS